MRLSNQCRMPGGQVRRDRAAQPESSAPPLTGGADRLLDPLG
jgi:hypothetical protein